MPANNGKQTQQERIRELEKRIVGLPPGEARDAAVQELEHAEREMKERDLVELQRENWKDEGGQGP